MWLAIGLILGIGIVILVLLLRQWRISVHWYEWFTGALGIALGLFALQNYTASLAEFELVAAQRSLLIFGLPASLLLILALSLSWGRWNRNKQGKKSSL